MKQKVLNKLPIYANCERRKGKCEYKDSKAKCHFGKKCVSKGRKTSKETIKKHKENAKKTGRKNKGRKKH